MVPARFFSPFYWQAAWGNYIEPCLSIEVVRQPERAMLTLSDKSLSLSWFSLVPRMIFRAILYASLPIAWLNPSPIALCGVCPASSKQIAIYPECGEY